MLIKSSVLATNFNRKWYINRSQTYLAVHAEIDLSQPKSNIGMVKSCHKVGVDPTQNYYLQRANKTSQWLPLDPISPPSTYKSLKNK